LVASELLLSAQRLRGGPLGMLITMVLLSVALSIALLKLRNWARWIVIVFYGMSLIGVPARVVTSHDVVGAFVTVLPGLYLLWAVWYLFQPHVKAAFGTAQP
jgi:threonine/homoserine efflux transporter RhtA